MKGREHNASGVSGVCRDGVEARMNEKVTRDIEQTGGAEMEHNNAVRFKSSMPPVTVETRKS